MSTEPDGQTSDNSMDVVADLTLDKPAVASSARSVSFDEFYTSEFRQVLGLAYVLTGNKWIAEELTQEAFIAAYKKWGKVKTYESPQAWVRRVLCNQATSSFRKKTYEAKAILKLKIRLGSGWHLDDEPDEFWQIVRLLPARQAQVIALHYLEDMSVSEIASVIGCAEGTVKTHLSRGREFVARSIEQ